MTSLGARVCELWYRVPARQPDLLQTAGASQSRGKILKDSTSSNANQGPFQSPGSSKFYKKDKVLHTEFSRMHICILSIPEVPTILSIRFLAGVLKMASTFDETHSLACSMMFSQNAGKPSCLASVGDKYSLKSTICCSSSFAPVIITMATRGRYLIIIDIMGCTKTAIFLINACSIGIKFKVQLRLACWLQI